MMRMTEERIPRKLPHKKWREHDQEEDPKPDSLKGYRNERGKLGRNTRKQGE